MKPIFRSAMFGFHKDDVANFIAQQNHQFEARIADLKDQLESAKVNFEKEREQFHLDQNELSVLREKALAHQTHLRSIEKIVDSIKTKEEVLSAAFSESVAAVTNVGEDVARLKEKLVGAKELKQKANRFDQLTSILGEIVSGKKADLSLKPQEVEEVSLEGNSIDDALSLLSNQREMLVSLQESCGELSEYLARLDSEK